MVALLQKIFNAEQLRRYDRPDGSIMHAELQIDDSIVMLGDSSEEFPPNQHLIHLYVSNVDTTYQKAIHLGCKPMEEPEQREGDPDRRGSFSDFAGNVWAIGTQLDD